MRVRRCSCHSSGVGRKARSHTRPGVVYEEVVNGLETQVAHGHGVDLGVDQGDGPVDTPFPAPPPPFPGEGSSCRLVFNLGRT